MSVNRVSARHLQDDPTALVSDAHAYFEGLGMGLSPESEAVAAAGDTPSNIQDSDGLVSYIVASTNPPPPELVALRNEVASVMEGLNNVVVSAILKQAGTDTAKKHDPQVWRAPMQAMVKAFCAEFSETEKHYHQSILGVDVASKFLNILMDAVTSQGTKAFDDFRNFLQDQGETIRTQVVSGQSRYLYANVSIVHEIFQASDGTWVYVPKFKSYFTQFTEETFKLTTACASFDSFTFDFDLQVMTAAFMISNWKDSESFREQVRQFIAKFQQVNIADSANYFEGIFNSTPDGSGSVPANLPKP